MGNVLRLIMDFIFRHVMLKTLCQSDCNQTISVVKMYFASSMHSEGISNYGLQRGL